MKLTMVKSQKEESSMEAITSQQFSPVSKPTTPKSTQGKNLTGPARHVRDLTADIHSCIQQWNTLHLQGLSVLKNIIEVKQDDSYCQELQELCNNLEVICDALDIVVDNLGQITHQLKIVATLHSDTGKLFMMWPTSKFGQVAETIYNAYYQESRVKRKILEDAAHNYTESWKMLCLATWVHQSLLPDNMSSLLESLLFETGHR